VALTVQASATREGDTLVVQIDDVVSPSIIARLNLLEAARARGVLAAVHA